MCNKPFNQKQIKDIQQQFYANFLPVAIQNYQEFLGNKSTDKQDKYIKYRASKDVVDGAGITGIAPSIYIQQTINATNAQVLNPIVQDLLGRLMPGTIKINDTPNGELPPEGGVQDVQFKSAHSVPGGGPTTKQLCAPNGQISDQDTPNLPGVDNPDNVSD